MKKRISILVAVLLTLVLLPALLHSSKAETSGQCGDNLYWSFDESTGTLTITGSGKMSDYEWHETPWEEQREQIQKLALPNGITHIGNSAFEECTGLASITIPNSVTSIGDCAFSECTQITAITIPNSVTTIGYAAFSNCYGLTSVTIPNSVISIDGYAFGYTGLKNVTIPSSITSIEDKTFINCSDLESVKIPTSVVSIGAKAFYGCDSLKTITIPNSVTQIGDWAFDASGLTSIVIPDSVTSLGWGAFEECKSLKTVTIGKGVTEIDGYMFAYSTALSEMTIPNGVTKIGSGAFTNCTALSEITIPNSVTSILNNAFYECTALTDVNYGGTESERYRKLPDSAIEWNNDPLLNATWHYLPYNTIEGTIEWNAEDVKFKGTTAYVVANGKAQTPRFTVKNSADGTVIDPEFYDYEYRENANAGTGYVIATFKGDYSGTCRGSFKIYLPATTTTTVANVSDGIKLTWSKVNGAAGYVIYRRAWSSTTNGWTDFVRWNNTTALNWTDTNVYAGTRYQYGIKAYFARRVDPVTGATIGGNVGDNYNLGEVGPLKTTVRITTRTLNSVTAGSKQMTVKWSGSSAFTGYQIQYATNSAFTQNAKAIKITNPKTASYTVKSLTRGTTYYVRIRSYHEFNGMTYFGEWSNVLSCKVK